MPNIKQIKTVANIKVKLNDVDTEKGNRNMSPLPSQLSFPSLKFLGLYEEESSLGITVYKQGL